VSREREFREDLALAVEDGHAPMVVIEEPPLGMEDLFE
jgi:hypothetical protein